MTDNHVAVEMDNLPDRQTDRSRDVSPARSAFTGSRRRVERGVSEIDEDGNDDRPDEYSPHGVDDGLLSSDGSTNKRRPNTSNEAPTPNSNGGIPRRRANNPFPIPGQENTGTVMIDGIETQIPDFNAYQHKKTLAQGMMDLALLSANANQLRYVLESYRRHPYFYPSVIFISISIIFQVAVGIGLIMNSRYNVKDDKEICKANKINNMTVIGIFIVTVVNVFISSFGVADAPDGV